jgi:hypothetical protein
MNTVSRQAPVAPLVSFSKVINRPHAGVGDEKLSIVIRSTEDAVEVGLLNHDVLSRSGSVDLAAIGLKLPADVDGQAFVEAFVAAYAAPPTLRSLFEGWATPVFEEYGGGFDQSVENTLVAHFAEAGDLSPEQHETYRAEAAQRIQDCEKAAAALN